MMEATEMFRFGQILINELEKGINNLRDPHEEELHDILNRSYRVKTKMQILYSKCESIELLNQMNQLDSIIKKVEQLHNKHVTEM